MNATICDWCESTASYSLGSPDTATIHMCIHCKEAMKKSTCPCGVIFFVRNHHDPTLDTGLCPCCYDTITPLKPIE